MTKRYDSRRARSHRTYTAREISKLFGVTVTTISHWRGEGLTAVDAHRPYLYAGAELAAFLRAKNKPRQPCGDGELYCVACRAPCEPYDGTAVVVPRSATSVDLVGVCPRCRKRPHRRMRILDLPTKARGLTLLYEDEAVPIAGTGDDARIATCELEPVG